jgi:hypothetical protein
MAERADPITAHVSGYADEGRTLLQRAHALAPDDPWPDGLLGIWHLQLVRRGSAMLAAELYGASEADGLRLCRQAAARAPRAIALRYGCAVSMLELDPEGLGTEAARELTAIGQVPAADAAERLVQEAALRLERRAIESRLGRSRPGGREDVSGPPAPERTADVVDQGRGDV